MCLGSIARLAEVRQDHGVCVGRLDDESTVPLSFVPAASAGDYLLLHLGIPVEILDPQDAREALALRRSGQGEGGGWA